MSKNRKKQLLEAESFRQTVQERQNDEDKGIIPDSKNPRRKCNEDFNPSNLPTTIADKIAYAMKHLKPRPPIPGPECLEFMEQ